VSEIGEEENCIMKRTKDFNKGEKTMKTKLIRRSITFFVLAASLLLGTLLGSSGVLADIIYDYINSGWNYCDGTFEWDGYYEYKVSHWVWVDASETEAFADTTNYWDGDVDPGYEEKYVFGPLYIMDQECDEHLLWEWWVD
jgi:hypothetical protein